MSNETEIQAMLASWAGAVRTHDLEAVLNDRSPNIVMFDVPEPLQHKGVDAYRDTWKLYFSDEGSRLFELRETHIVANGDVAWVRAVLRCTTASDPAGRLTMGLRKVNGRWVVEHEHHSFPTPLGSAP
jgi:ketosteroid isomerase-like protein